MAERYAITPTQVAVLRALREGIAELSPIEIAVRARLLPNQVRSAVKDLESLGLANSWKPDTSSTTDDLIALPAKGQKVSNALACFKRIPSAGTFVPISRSLFSEWLSRDNPSFVEIIPEE